MSFPVTRLRRMRQTDSLRSLVRETRLTPTGFIYPLFVCPGEGVRKEISSMPGVYNLSVDQAVKEAQEAKSLGVGGIILFGLPEKKDEVATGAWVDDGIVQRATRAIKREVRDLVVIGDVCLCEYMSHGHCGIVQKKNSPASGGSTRRGSNGGRGGGNGGRSAVATQTAAEVEYEILNDETLELLAKTAVSQARAGMDIIAPSDMMDGRVGAIRKALDQAGFINTPILSYAAKFASGFYGPFREAADSAPQFGDRRSYQMDGANLREAMREIALDIKEGADMIMVKPAMPYLDVIAEARRRFDVPIAAYQVSGEYAMLQAAIRLALDDAGLLNTPILSYAAKFASGFYGPFREAADSAPQFGDRRSYQMDPANLREAMREIEADLEEGADMIMVKPAMPYLDVIAAARDRFDVPLAAYQVSGEFAMIEAAARNNWIEHDRVMMESLLCIRRAGASIILTYFAKHAARLLA